MKKSVLSILTFCFVFMGVLAFSCPVLAASGDLATFANKSYTSSRSVYIDTSVYYYKEHYDATGYNLAYFATSESGSFSVSLPFPIWQFNGNSGLPFPIGKAGKISFRGFSGSTDVIGSLNSSNIIVTCTAASIVCPDGSVQPLALADNSFNQVVYFQFPFDSYYIHDSFRIVLEYTYQAHPSSSSSTGLSIPQTGYLRFQPKYAFSSCVIGWVDSLEVSSSDIIDQTAQINNNITQQTEKQTESLQNGYDNSSMTDDNSRLNDQMQQYDQAQEETTNNSTAYIDAAEFVNPFENASVLASVTFATSFLQSLFLSLDIWQLVVTVSLCLVLALMLVGWFKFRKD